METDNTQNEIKDVLLVEDDQVLREMYAVALIHAGLNISMAENGAQGIAMALKHKPKLVLFDIEMPTMSGHEAAQKLREDEWGKNVKIIFLTNRAEPQHEAHAGIVNPEDYIVKSRATIQEVVEKVKTALGS